jgi:hypothetical protein
VLPLPAHAQPAEGSLSPQPHPLTGSRNPRAAEVDGAAAPFRRGCRKKSSEKTRSRLAEVHVKAAVRDDLATDGPFATDEMAVLVAHLLEVI